MMTVNTAQASQQALLDWENQSALHLVNGTIGFELPRYHWGQIFYTQSIAEELSPQTELYCRTYNLTIHSLLKKHGVPAWAPVKRLPDAMGCLTRIAQQSLPYPEYRPASPQEEEARDRILSRWGSSRPLVWSRLHDSALLLFGGDLADRSGRIDVLDYLKGGCWMAFYLYPRVEFPSFPWDK